MADHSPPLSAVSEEEPLTPLDRRYLTMVRCLTALTLVVPLLAAAGVELAGLPLPGMAIGPVLLIAALLLLRLPRRRYRASGYDMAADRLRVVRGAWWRRDIIVPFSRVQHIDVAQGPAERLFGLGTLVLHTAGNHNSSVALPGLAQPQALAMRDAIRAHLAAAAR
ncbi:PH domain-containing protein [Croceibacterium sp. TMG7-5b_MA50]|uniref:PH domain-containing protein n=1 Tax=Croceibacterium sp. TMG7-5b_MA50 TaxID=3121290 RepID=UPI0032215EFF